MKAKIIAILVMTLLIGAGTIVVADWEEGDGHKMHYPQEPDPNGWDVGWGGWALGDDWQCSETGNVTDIHFWISWWNDSVQNISYLNVNIFGNDPNGPDNHSIPSSNKWQRIFSS